MTEETEYEKLKRSIDEWSNGHSARVPSFQRILNAALLHLKTLPKPVERPAWRISYLHVADDGRATVIQSRPLYTHDELWTERQRLNEDINCRDLRIHNPNGRVA